MTDIANSSELINLRPALREVLQAMRTQADIQAVSIRLHEQEDFPYFEHTGFPDYFITRETRLLVDATAATLSETPRLACMCGNVLQKRFDPSMACFTANGSFWTNSTSHFLTTLTEDERRSIGETRNTCHHFGYESVALIPIPSNGRHIGLLQLNDPREGRFTVAGIAAFESIAVELGRVITNAIDTTERIRHITQLVNNDLAPT